MIYVEGLQFTFFINSAPFPFFSYINGFKMIKCGHYVICKVALCISTIWYVAD